jgi:glycosyltransferase involved in cell wall biosynthesis
MGILPTMRGTVCVCIPAYRGRFLAETIESVLNQTRQASEIIVLDDCSPDNLESIVSNYIQNGVRYIRNPQNVGVPANYNRIFNLSTSDYLMIFGDHDVMKPNYIEKCAGLLDSDSSVVYVFSNVEAINDLGIVIQHYHHRFPRVFEGERLAQYLVTHTRSPINLDTLIRRAALNGLEPWFDPKYWWYADIYLWIRLARKGKVGYIDEVILQRRGKEKEHYLNDKIWESMLVCDRIRYENWSSAYSHRTLRSLWGKVMYAYRRDIDGFLFILSQLANGIENVNVLPDEALRLFSPPSKLIVPFVVSLPNRFVRRIRDLFRHLSKRFPATGN